MSGVSPPVCAHGLHPPAFGVTRLCFWYIPLILPHYAVGGQGEVELVLSDVSCLLPTAGLHAAYMTSSYSSIRIVPGCGLSDIIRNVAK